MRLKNKFTVCRFDAEATLRVMQSNQYAEKKEDCHNFNSKSGECEVDNEKCDKITYVKVK